MSFNVRHISDFLELWAPPSTSMDYDNVGLLIGSLNQEVTHILTCLDVTEEVVNEAIENGAELIVAHHPLIFSKLSRITDQTAQGRLIKKLLKNDLSVYAFHTNFDAASNGVSKKMAEQLGLANVSFLREEAQSNTGFGMIGELESPLSTDEFSKLLEAAFHLSNFRFSGEVDMIQRVAVCGGTGSFLIADAIRKQANAYITADIKYHEYFVDAPLMLVDIGHYESEIGAMDVVATELSKTFPELIVSKTSINTNPMRYFKSTKTQTLSSTQA